MDFKEQLRFYSDQTVAVRRIHELLRLKNRALVLPALKDHLILVFEKMYKAKYRQLKDMFRIFIADEN